MDVHTRGDSGDMTFTDTGGAIGSSGGNVTVTFNPSFDFAGLVRAMVQQGQIRLAGARDPDDGAAGVPVSV